MISHYVHRIEQIPDQECWVIMKDMQVHIEGDERSRNFPGHGYPASTDNYAQVYMVFPTEEEFLDEMKKLVAHAPSWQAFRGFKIQPYTVKHEVVVGVFPKS